jgi:RNA polymerase sigma-70 factor (ECF subfamily)
MVASQLSAEFLRLWNEHSRHIYAYIYTLVGNWPDADDVFQETSFTLMSKLDEFTVGTNFRAWACRIAYLKCLEFFRSNRLSNVVQVDFLEVVDQELSLLQGEVEPRFSALAECLASLSEKDRSLIQLRYYDGQDVNTIAAILGRSTRMIYKSLARIHERLLECIRVRIVAEDR